VGKNGGKWGGFKEVHLWSGVGQEGSGGTPRLGGPFYHI
jgi:hypothetical protein